MLAERGRCESHAPRRVNRPQSAPCIGPGDEAVECLGLKIEHVNQTVSGSRNIILFVGILLGEGHEDHAFDGLDVEGRVSGRRV